MLLRTNKRAGERRTTRRPFAVFFSSVALSSCIAVATPLARRCESRTRAQQPSPSQPAASIDADARRSLDAALEALGGARRLKALASLVIETKGREHRSAEAQGYDPELETDAAHEELMVAVPSEEKFLYEHKTGRHDGTTRWRRWSYERDERTISDFVTRFAAARRFDGARAERLQRERRVPHLLLLEADRNPSNLASLGAADYRGRRHDVVSFRLPGEKTTIKLFFDGATRLLTKYEYLMDLPSYGDTTVEVIYDGYRRHERLGWFPTRDEIRVGGKAYRTVAYTNVEADSPRAGARFELPEDLKSHLAAQGSVSEVARGVFLVNSLGNLSPMFVEFKDFVLAVEAPSGYFSLDSVPPDSQPGASTFAEQFIAKIKETVPGKPVRYLAMTHSHGDHAGGARAFVAEGATLLTTPGNRKFFERMVAAPHTLVPDRLAREPRPLILETFATKRVVTDGERVVELINVGANPHTSENVVVYLPRERLMYQGDLFYFRGEETFPPKDRTTVMAFFARWLVGSGLAPERIYGAHDRGFATMAHVREVLEAATRRRAARPPSRRAT